MDLMTLCSVCLACTVLVVFLDGLSAVVRGGRASICGRFLAAFSW